MQQHGKLLLRLFCENVPTTHKDEVKRDPDITILQQVIFFVSI